MFSLRYFAFENRNKAKSLFFHLQKEICSWGAPGGCNTEQDPFPFQPRGNAEVTALGWLHVILGWRRASLELQPAKMSTGKAAFRSTPLSLLRDTPQSFPELPGDGTLCLAPLIVLAGSTRDSVGSTGWHQRKGTANVNRAGKCPSTPGLGTWRGWGSLGPWGWLGKPVGSAAASHQDGPKQPHIQPPPRLGGGHPTASRGAVPTYQSLTFCPAHFALWPALLGDPVALPCPSRHPSAACGWALLGFHPEHPDLCPEGANSLCPTRSSQLSNPAGIRHRDVGRAAGHRGVQGPSHHPGAMESVFLPEPRANTRGMNPAQTAHGLQSWIQMIKWLQGRAGSLAQAWWQRLCQVLATEVFELGKGCSCPLLSCSWCLEKELISHDREGFTWSSGPTLPGAWLSNSGEFSPVSA